MKNFKKIILGVFVTLMCFASVSCVKIFDQNYQIVHVHPGNSEEVVADGSIHFGNYTPATKAMAGLGPNGVGYDNFSMYGFKDGTAFMDPFNVVWQGNSWVYDGVGTQKLQYFDRNANQYDFVGIISDKTAVRTNQTVDIAGVEAFQTVDPMNSPKEFLYTQKTVLPANYGQTVNLTFNHGNARMFLGFASDRADTEILDYVPGNPGSPAIPGTPDTETYTSKTVKFIDELVAGNEVQVGIGFYGVNSPKLTKNQPNPLYVGTNNTSLSYMAKDWLLSIKDAVNAQFVYYRLNSVVNSTSKTETTEDWESAASNKNIFMMKLADGVDKAAFAAGNDVFWNALVAHENDWYGGSPAESFKDMFAQAYANGWRVIRINVSDANANQVLVFLSSNQEVTSQVCTIVPGTPDTPAVPATPGIEGIRVFSVDDSGSPIVHKVHTNSADAHVNVSSLAWDNVSANSDAITFEKPVGPVAQAASTSIAWADATPSPTIRYALPVLNTGYVVKFSYTYNGVSYYDARVLIPTASANFLESKDYTYIIYITDKTNGTTDPGQADTDQNDVDTTLKAIEFSEVSFSTYTTGGHYVYSIL